LGTVQVDPVHQGRRGSGSIPSETFRFGSTADAARADLMFLRGGRLVAFSGLLFLGSAAWSQCSRPTAPTPRSNPPMLLGEMTAVVSVKELMANMIDPFADDIFDAVWWETSARGVVAHRPTTDDDWQKVRTGAVTIAEGIYLLKVPRPFAPPGDVNDSLGPNPPELSPAQIHAKLDHDPVLWNAKIEALRNVALATLEATKHQDVEALFQAGADLDAACEACHLEYWYPGDRNIVTERSGRATFETTGGGDVRVTIIQGAKKSKY
jgi:hypothetical protein